MKAIGGKFAVAVMSASAALAQDASYQNSIGMEFILIRPGSMQVGVFQPDCPEPAPPGVPAAKARPDRRPPDPRVAWTEADYAKCRELARQDASPGFTATIVKPYYIGRYEVTQGQWKK